MGPRSIFSNLTSSLDRALRKKPWLYGLISSLALGLLILVIFAVSINGPLNDRKVVSDENFGPVDSNMSNEESGRLVLLNIINRFHKEESTLPTELSAGERKELKKEHLRRMLTALQSVRVGGTVDQARQDLIILATQWQDLHSIDQSTNELTERFTSIGVEYPWLNALIRIILLNHL